MISTLSARRILAKSLREFLGSEERKNWKLKRLSIEMWDLCPELQREFRTAVTFWEEKGKTIEHICRGRYDKEGDSLLYAGFDAFARKHIPSYFSELRRLRTPSVAEVASTLDLFLPTHSGLDREWPVNIDESMSGNNVRLMKVVAIEGRRQAELGNWMSSCLAYRPLSSDSRYFAAVWFSVLDTAIHCQGFVLPTRGLLVMRWAARPAGYLLASIRLFQSEIGATEVALASVKCELISDFRAGPRGQHISPQTFRLKTVYEDKLKAEAEVLLNFLDKPA